MFPLDWIALLFFVSFSYFDGITAMIIITPTDTNNTPYRKSFIKTLKKLTDNAIPDPLVFSIIWSILYGLIGVAIFLYWKNSTDDTIIFNSVMGCYFVNIVLNHLYYPIFFLKYYSYETVNVVYIGFMLGLLDVLLILASGIYITARFALNEQWISFAFFLIYDIWCVYVLHLSLIIITIPKEELSRKFDVNLNKNISRMIKHQYK
jgi:tryptophan-rich sensory protein